MCDILCSAGVVIKEPCVLQDAITHCGVENGKEKKRTPQLINHRRRSDHVCIIVKTNSFHHEKSEELGPALVLVEVCDAW
jgi:hypothetical protein